jgi:hypothetical protein
VLCSTCCRPSFRSSSAAKATRVITLRQERGYSATNYDRSAAKRPKTLRRQFGNFYDVKKVRNTEATLAERKKGDVEKVKIAILLRKETLATVGWIAARLQMGSVANVNTLL